MISRANRIMQAVVDRDPLDTRMQFIVARNRLAKAIQRVRTNSLLLQSGRHLSRMEILKLLNDKNELRVAEEEFSKFSKNYAVTVAARVQSYAFRKEVSHAYG